MRANAAAFNRTPPAKGLIMPRITWKRLLYAACVALAGLAALTAYELLRSREAQRYYAQGFDHEKAGEYEAAIADYAHAIGIISDYAEAYNNSGISYAALGEYEKAIDDYTQAIGIISDYAAAYYNRGNAYADLGEYDKAIADYTHAVDIDPDYAEAYANRGSAYVD